ncbi:MAG TPA: glycosyltransferase [Caldimonas sp.]|nr:glycosyltransferase [Caldimonas sp.]
MMTRPIAVITVCRIPGVQLAAAIESVQALGDVRTKQIIIDGASTDGTPAHLKSIESSLHHWSTAPDSGIYDAMNKGWAAAPADSYVIFIGAGDLLLGLPSADELLQVERDGVAIIYGVTRTALGAFRSRYGAELRLRNTLHHQSLLVRKEAYLDPPFDTRYRIYGD